MKRFLNGVLVALILVGSMAAKTYTDKTFLMPRSHNPNLAMEYTTWHKQMALIDDNKFGGTIEATGFYEKSNNKVDLGRYFGVCNYYQDSCIDDFIAVVPYWPTGPNPKHVDGGFLFHTYNSPASSGYLTLADKLTWRPYRESYGVRLDYHQKLDKILKGLFFKVSAPIVHVKTSLGWSSSCCQPSCATSCKTTCTPKQPYCTKQKLQNDASGTLKGTAYSVGDYLTGCVKNDYANAKQAALCKAKIHNGQSETGIADIDLIIGYNFLYKNEKHVNVNIGLTIPTGNTPDGTWLWEPVVGNGGHWALGAGLDTHFELWKDDDKSLDLIFALNYRYLFSSTEKRTFGYKWPAGTTLAGTPGTPGSRVLYGHWLLGAKTGDKIATPLANYMTRDLKITPGSQFDGIIQLAFNYENWTFDAGYNLYAKEGESLSLKCDPCTTEASSGSACSTSGCDKACDGWTDGTYGIAGPFIWNTAEAFAPANSNHIFGTANSTIQRTDICLDSCTQDSVTTHKLYGGIGYAFKEWEYPLMLGIGGSYEFANENNALEAWSLWAKIGLTF